MTRQAGFLLAAALLGLPAAAQDAEFGGLLFESFCSSCHGEDGKGQGQLAAFLAIHPPDLTQLAAGNDGVFPVSRVVRQIDGRDPELAHGGVMPLFGEYFDLSDTAVASETGQPILTAGPIADMVVWLQSVQE
jgi:mono/diheme cytochrome c family protein